MVLGYVVVGSFLLMQTWNKVVTHLSTFKSVSFKQALLVAATMAFFCLPKMMMHHGNCGHGAGKSCPYPQHGAQTPAAPDAAPQH